MDNPQGGVRERAPGQPRFPEVTWPSRIASRVRFLAPERLVAVGRVVVATLLLIEVAFVLNRPWAAAAFLLGGYLLFSICVAALPRRLLAPARLHVFTLFADASIFGALVVVGEEPVGAYIVLAAVIVLASAFVWQWRGALVGATGLATLLIAAGYAHLLIERASEVPVTAAVANGDSAPPLTTGSIGFDAATYFQSVLVHAGYVLVLGAMFATLVVAGRRVAPAPSARTWRATFTIPSFRI